jgi:signal transduction histidine kinase
VATIEHAAPPQDEQRPERRKPREPEPGFPPLLYVYAAALLVSLGVFVPGVVEELGTRPVELLLWTVFVGAASQLVVAILPRSQMDASLGAPVSIAAAVLFTPAFAAAATLVGSFHIRELRGQAKPVMSVFNRSQLAWSAAAAGIAAEWAGGFATGTAGTLLGALAGVVVYNYVNASVVSIATWLRGFASLGTALKQNSAPVPRFFVDFGFSLLLAVLIVIAYQAIGPLAVVLLALPLWLGYSALRSARIAEDRADQLAKQVTDLQTLNATAEELLTSRSDVHAAAMAQEALRTALGLDELDEVELALDGRVAPGLRRVPITGGYPATIGVPEGLPDPTMAVVEAIAGFVGMTLTRQQLEQELAEVQRARAALAGRILEEGNAERSRMASELHDDVLPAMAAVQIQSDNVRAALDRARYARADELAAAAADSVHDAIRRLRGVLEDVKRQTVTPGSLPRGIARALADLKLHHGVDAKLILPNPMPHIPFALEILMLETARGALANVGLHAAANHVQIEVDTTEAAIWMEVRDDGRGFDPRELSKGHDGLALMTQRVELTRGRFVIDSAVGRGTRLRMEVPL